MSEKQTLGDRLPDALRRVGRLLGGDVASKMHRDLLADLMSIHAAASEFEKSKAEINRLAAFVERLQKTEDGVCITHGTRVYWWEGDQIRFDDVCTERWNGMESVSDFRGCYSSREAAEKAREQ